MIRTNIVCSAKFNVVLVPVLGSLMAAMNMPQWLYYGYIIIDGLYIFIVVSIKPNLNRYVRIWRTWMDISDIRLFILLLGVIKLSGAIGYFTI